MSLTTFPVVLEDQLRRNGSRPLVTFYDDVTGERVELSAVTYANWVAKTAGVLQDELELERGATVLLDLPTHWLAPVWLGACWTTGLTVTDDPAGDHSLVVCGPDHLEQHAAGSRPVVALSLLPMGRRFAGPLPPGVVDFGVVVWGQPDAFHPYDAPEATDPAWAGPRPWTQQELLQDASRHSWGAPGTRLLTDLRPTSEPGLHAFLGPLIGGGGTVWLAHPSEDRWRDLAGTERVTASHVSAPS